MTLTPDARPPSDRMLLHPILKLSKVSALMVRIEVSAGA